MQACSAGRGQSGFSRQCLTAHLAAMIASKGALQAASVPSLCARGRAAAALGRDRKVRPGPRQSSSGPRAQGTQAPVQGPRCADSSSAGLARALAIFTAWQQSLAGVKLCKPSPKNPIPKKLRSVVRFAFHQIVLANSIQNLHSDSRLTDAIDDDPRNHFRTPISGTTR